MSFKFLGVHNINKLSWSKHTKTVVKSARQHIFPLRRLKRFGTCPQILITLYSCTIESILTGCITAWNGNCLASDHNAQQSVVHMTQYITGAKLPAIQDLYTRWCHRKLSKTPATQVIDCLLCYHMASGTGVPSLGPKGSLTDSTPKL